MSVSVETCPATTRRAEFKGRSYQAPAGATAGRRRRAMVHRTLEFPSPASNLASYAAAVCVGSIVFAAMQQ